MSRSKLSQEQEKILVQEFLNGESVNNLCIKYGYKTGKSITDKIKKYVPDYNKALQEAKINRREWSYSFLEIKNYFDAYFIGLLLTDGYLTSRGTDIGIDLIDEDCINFLSKTIGKEYKTYYSDRKAFNKYNTQPKHRLILSGKEIVEEAKRYGIVANKTYKLKGFELKEKEYKFIPYLIRGIIDGDGCIYQTSYGTPAFYIISKSQDFLEWTKKLLENHLYLSHLTLKETSDNLFKIETAHKDDIFKLICLVYDKPFGMQRKYNKIRQTFRDYNGNIFIEDDGIVQTTTEMV